MSTTEVQLALWIVQPVLLVPLAIVIYRRKLHKDFPFFFAFVLLEILTFIVEFPVYHLFAYRVYFCTFWTSAALDLVFNFKTIHEIFLDVFRPYNALKDLGGALFKWAAIAMVLVSGAFISTHLNSDDPVGRSIMVLHRCVEGIQCGMVLFLLAFCGHLGVSWRRQSFGITLGLGCFAGTELIACALFSGGHISINVLNTVRMTAYSLAELIWLFYSVLNGGKFFSQGQRPGSPESLPCGELCVGHGLESVG